MGYLAKIKKQIAEAAESDWRFVSSAGVAATVETPFANVGVSALAGKLWLQNMSESNVTELGFVALGPSLGVSSVPLPANVSFSLPSMPSSGKVYKLAAAGLTLTLDEIRGAFVMCEYGGDFASVGGSIAIMLVGGNVKLATLIANSRPETMALNIIPFIATAEGCVAFGGATGTVISGNFSATIYSGIIL